ncbi:hypothetical protein Hypma_004343 [Hypsizygus marmoreus]|uniref:Uncharacterized protein n=1 Tax=Hypsizygus marmoreus TaxID=39966 RepID=A0A369JYH3_HYPMA|nr:hypothetical protein Hypma_004343 [Hypsizygus marmoreus]
MPKIASASYIQSKLHSEEEEDHSEDQASFMDMPHSGYADIAHPSTDRTKRAIIIGCTFEPAVKLLPKKKRGRGKGKAKEKEEENVVIKSGVSIEQCCRGEGMWDEGRRVFVHKAMEGVDGVVFRLKFHGYEHVDWHLCVPTVGENGEPLTRKHLAFLLGIHIKEFVDRCSSGQFISTDAEWSFGDNGTFSLDKILLDSAYSRDSVNWMVTLRVLVKPGWTTYRRLVLRDGM